ncbi:hypothetical protein [Streptomyces sp. NPDC057702]|uniref:hypothetical protein n=1 Tax=unclassified Streptomyces TaxID=2593676 RepID=UPI0036BEB3F0
MRQELMSLPKTLAEDVARNLVMVARLLDDDPEQAYAYARIALRLASRVAAVREAAGFASYAVGKYAEALAEFRTARRMTGSAELWPVMADCERGMGRPERALAMAGEPEVQKLDRAGQVEMRLVAAGARRDMGQADAAVVTLQSPELASSAIHPWTARLRYAYADALLSVERRDEAREWFAKALEADQGGTTDASDRLAELDGVEFVDALEGEDDEVPGAAVERGPDRDAVERDDDTEVSDEAAAGDVDDAELDTEPARDESAGAADRDGVDHDGDVVADADAGDVETASDSQAREADDVAGDGAPAGQDDTARDAGAPEGPENTGTTDGEDAGTRRSDDA